ncbi:hypothetical protein TorRG33x02_349850, partial [Trema orientale]
VCQNPNSLGVVEDEDYVHKGSFRQSGSFDRVRLAWQIGESRRALQRCKDQFGNIQTQIAETRREMELAQNDSPLEDNVMKEKLVAETAFVRGALQGRAFLETKIKDLLESRSEILLGLLAREEENGNNHGIKLSQNGQGTTHLAFADDILFFGRATRREAAVFMGCLNKYCDWSGQSVNQGKSSIVFSRNLRGQKGQEINQLL